MRKCWRTEHSWLLSASKRGFFSRPNRNFRSLIHDERLLFHLVQKLLFIWRWILWLVDDFDHFIIIERSIESYRSWFNYVGIIRHSSRRDVSFASWDQRVPFRTFLFNSLFRIFQRCHGLIYRVYHIWYINFSSFALCRLNVIRCDWTIKILELDWLSCFEEGWA